MRGRPDHVLGPLLVVLSLAILPAPAEAEQAGKVWRLGFLSPRSGFEYRDEAFRRALGQLGYVEGGNLVIEWRFTKGRRGHS
jgi:hypothetical protein